MKIHRVWILAIAIILFGAVEAYAQAVGIGTFNPRPDFTSEIVTDKVTYKSGEIANAVVYVENKTTIGMQRYPGFDTEQNQYVSLHSDPELSGGGQFYQKLTVMPKRENMGIMPGAKRPYMAFSFSLVDTFGKPLPGGYYALTHSNLAFRDASTNTVRHAGDAAKVFFIEPSRQDQIKVLYRTILGRTTDPSSYEVQYWDNTGMTIDQIKQAFYQSYEYRSRH